MWEVSEVFGMVVGEVVFEKKFGRVPKRAVKPVSVEEFSWSERNHLIADYWVDVEERKEKDFKVGNVVIKGEIVEGRLPYVGYVRDVVLKKFDFDAVKPAYKTVPNHVEQSGDEETFRKLFNEAWALYREVEELQKIDVRIRYLIMFYDNIPFGRGLAYLEVLKEYNREQVKKLKKALSEVEERERKVRELSKKIRELNRELRRLSKEAYQEYRKETEEGIKAFYKGEFERAIALLGWRRFEKLAKEEFGLSWVKITDAKGSPWRAIVAVSVDKREDYTGAPSIQPDGGIILMGFDDNDEKWQVSFENWDLASYDLTVEKVEAFIFDVSERAIKRLLYDRQGDVAIFKGGDVIKGFVEEKATDKATELVIVSKHVLKSEKPFLYVEEGNKTFVLLEAPAVLEHPEHHNVELEPGAYVFAVASIPEVVD